MTYESNQLAKYQGYVRLQERESTSLAHHGIKGQKWGLRRYQNEDGTLTEEGKKHYGAAERRTSNLVGKATSSESEFEKSAYSVALNQAIRKQLSNVISKSLSPDVDLGCEVADEYSLAAKELDDAFQVYSRKLKEDTGRSWDGDGTEEHLKLKETYPEYAELAKKEQVFLKDLVDVSKVLAKDKDFEGVKGFDKTSYLYVSFPKYGDWYKVGDQRAYAIAQALITRNDKNSSMSELILPQYFIDSYDAHGKKLPSTYFNT